MANVHCAEAAHPVRLGAAGRKRCRSLQIAPEGVVDDRASTHARVDLEGELRQVRREMDGILLGAGEPALLTSVEKACRASGPLDAEALLRILATPAVRTVVLGPEDPERIFGDLG